MGFDPYRDTTTLVTAYNTDGALIDLPAMRGTYDDIFEVESDWVFSAIAHDRKIRTYYTTQEDMQQRAELEHFARYALDRLHLT